LAAARARRIPEGNRRLSDRNGTPFLILQVIAQLPRASQRPWPVKHLGLRFDQHGGVFGAATETMSKVGRSIEGFSHSPWLRDPFGA